MQWYLTAISALSSLVMNDVDQLCMCLLATHVPCVWRENLPTSLHHLSQKSHPSLPGNVSILCLLGYHALRFLILFLSLRPLVINLCWHPFLHLTFKIGVSQSLVFKFSSLLILLSSHSCYYTSKVIVMIVISKFISVALSSFQSCTQHTDCTLTSPG